MWLRALLLPTLFLGFVAPASAALDAEYKTPYRLRVVLKVAPHPQLTPSFRADLRRDLLGSLQAALGPLGTVEVIDLAAVDPKRWEPLWKLVAEKGLQALDSANEIDGVKTHFVEVDFADGQYELRARQHDGTSGFVTPEIRAAHSYQAALVARFAGLMVGKDFGIVGTFEPGGEHVTVKLKGGGLGRPVERFVRKGEVFAAVRVVPAGRRSGGKGKGKDAKPHLAGQRVEGVLLRVQQDPKDGVCTCRVFSRYRPEDAFPRRSNVLGYRCVKLGTTEAPLRLQLVDEKGVPHKPGSLHVQVFEEGFPDMASERNEAVFRNGVYLSKRPMANLACVRVSLGTRTLAQMPVPILGEGVEVRQVKLDPGAEQRSRLELARQDVMIRIIDGRVVQARLFQELTALEGKEQFRQALDRAEAAYKALNAEGEQLQEDLDRLRARVKQEAPKDASFLSGCEQQLQDLLAKQKELSQHIDQLKEGIRQANDPTIAAKKKKLDDLTRQADLLLSQAEVGQAIKVYEQILEEVPGQAQVQARLEQLKKAWEPRDAEHAAARKFAYEVWPKLTTFQEMRDQLPQARKALEKARQVGDRFTLIKLRLGNTQLASRLVEQAKPLLQSQEEEDLKTLEALKKVGEDLGQFDKELVQALGGGKGE